MVKSKSNIAVIGAGLMGHGIAFMFARAGHAVNVFDPVQEVRDTLPERLRGIAELLQADRACITRIEACADLQGTVRIADFVIEAAPEKVALKQQIFADLERLAPAAAILATNTSVIPIREVSRSVNGRERVVGAHFWNPPYLVPLVEVVQMEAENLPAVRRTIALLRSAGWKPVHVKRDIPGFIGNRLQHALKREAIALVADGVCDAETVDEVVKLGFGSRLAVLGPMEQSDLVGLNLTLDIHEVLIRHLDCTPGPHPLLIDLVRKGHLGMRTGQGFRTWTPEEAQAVQRRFKQFLADAARRAAQASPAATERDAGVPGE